MGAMQRTYRANGVLLVHGCPPDSTREYVYTTDVRNPNKMERIFSYVDHLCFVGHTHTPGVWTEDLTYRSPEELDYEYEITKRKTVINVGSVGQPRDGDPRACYATFDGSTVRWIKLRYDCEKTIRKIYAIDELDNTLGDRLREGR
jgi:diadenosine tetraphosphatase ApaH/serine/threonine PP2A family protein phosphatase